MNRFYFISFFAAIVLCLLNSCDDETTGTATYTGKVINEYTDAPLADVDVKVTNGDKIHSMTKTLDDGMFSIEVRLAEIDDTYYILIGNNKFETKRVEFPGFGNGRFDLGIITIKGPTIPTVKTTQVRVDNKTTVICEGTVTDEGDFPIIARGICWGTSTPTISNQKSSNGEGTGSFSTSITVTNVHAQNLYFRAYATNESGTAYGETVMINHKNPYNLPVVEDSYGKYIILPYDLPKKEMGGFDADYASLNYSGNTAYTSCENLVAYDYSDWTLPTRSILQIIYEHKDEIGGFLEKEYWTASYNEDSPMYTYDVSCKCSKWGHWYYYVDFMDGDIDFGNGLKGVRPVRKY